MTKKLSLTLTAIVTMIGLTAFSISNAFALDGDTPPQDSAPLTSAKQICKDLTASYAESIANAKAFGLSLQKTKEEIAQNIKDIQDAKKLACKEAKEAKKTCDKEYKKSVEWAKAKGLTGTITKEELTQILDELEMEKNMCNGDPLTSPVKLCKEASKNYYKEVKAMKAKGLSSGMTKEELQAEIDAIKAYKKAICAEAKAAK